MRIAIMGTGGVGGYYGARLAQAGNEVCFIARGSHLAAMQEKGLHVKSSLGDITLPKPTVTDNPASLSPVDVVLFCVKLWDTEAAARQIKALLNEDTMVISLQNGVQKDEILSSILGQSHIVGGTSYISSTIESPGIINHFGTLQKIHFGEYNDQKTPRAQAFFEACQKAGIDVYLSDNIRKEIWQKFVFLVGLSGTTASMHTSIGPIRSNPTTRAFLLDCISEVVAVARASGVDFEPDFAEKNLSFYDKYPEAMIASMAVDLKRGRRLELPWLSGAVVNLGKKFGINTPVNRAINAILILHAEGKQL